ncbi:COX15/CtaA family protein [Spirosoma fluviale]|uniref:Cytochrome c oxidase assembly protein subunit 15 n=1 Tax=Spirosoma fluviale TaxID=1597977 RepID=A0A286GLR6_9BACT|nr:COX15/CtaA family protein [Spirosoma fluviale]SOD96039.1 cytochrome c oxidase assembly protein subunit 15 [Spirosoma fluviale]
MISSNSLINKKEQRFQSLAFLTVIVIYLLILAGGIVRGTGSGMGCPDWPKCFGQWIPPTEISQLPANYQEVYGAKLKGEIEFNAVKTWIEYINRLLGVLSGFLVFATLINSFTYLRKDKSIVIGSLVAFLMIGVNGWLGSRVVATELAQHMITLHLLLAIVVVFALLFVLIRANAVKLKDERNTSNIGGLRGLVVLVMILTLGQIILGAQVRDALDFVVKRLGYAQRNSWIEGLDWRFYIHRSFSLVLFGLHVLVLYRLRKLSTSIVIRRLTNYLIILVVAEIGTGVIMAYLGVPAAAQPIHLLLAILIVGLQFSVSILLTPKLLIAQDKQDMSQLVQA